MTGLEATRSALRELEGRPFTAIGRAATLVWLTFGDDVPWAGQRGEHTVRPEMSLHLQCRWRLLNGVSVVVQDGDLHVPDAGVGAGFEAGGEIGTSRFDERAEAVAQRIALDAPVVDQVRIGDESDLQMTLSSGMSLEVFPAGCPGREDWRLLSSGEARAHIVVENGSAFTV